jgi:RNA polymerase sigma-70 factor (ECF subfamily)
VNGFFDPIALLASSLEVAVMAAGHGDASDLEQTAAGDLERVQRALEDRREAEQLLRELLPRVRNLVRYLVREDSDVDDIAQEALLAVLKGLHTYKGTGRLKSWADRIVARVTFAEIPKRRRAPSRPPHEAVNFALLPSSSAQVDEYLARRRVVELLDRVPDAQRHAMVLHHVMGLTVPEIADQLQVSAETVRSRLRLGKKRLEALSRGEESDEKKMEHGDGRAEARGR